MKLYVGITDRDWFSFLRAKGAEEMNFWRPKSTQTFGAIAPNELFLFKTRYPENKIVGGAFFVRHTTLPLDLAWEVFKEADGADSFEAFRRKIQSLRQDQERNPTIGCTVLTQPFYLRDDEFFPAPSDWGSSIMTGKRYDAQTGEGARLYEQAKEAIMRSCEVPAAPPVEFEDSMARFGKEIIMRPRLGQGGFRVVVMDGYERRCAMTGERTLPVLEAAHIRPYGEDGPHDIRNGLFLRSDLHTLFDRWYLTITNDRPGDYRIEVSRRIRDEFSNGRHYYELHGQRLTALPNDEAQRPAREFLEWHQDHFLGS